MHGNARALKQIRPAYLMTKVALTEIECKVIYNVSYKMHRVTTTTWGKCVWYPAEKTKRSKDSPAFQWLEQGLI
jgi:hypothetical protein